MSLWILLNFLLYLILQLVILHVICFLFFSTFFFFLQNPLFSCLLLHLQSPAFISRCLATQIFVRSPVGYSSILSPCTFNLQINLITPHVYVLYAKILTLPFHSNRQDFSTKISINDDTHTKNKKIKKNYINMCETVSYEIALYYVIFFYIWINI